MRRRKRDILKDDDFIGASVEGYTIKELISQGQYCKVYKVVEEGESDDIKVMKILKKTRSKANRKEFGIIGILGGRYLPACLLPYQGIEFQILVMPYLGITLKKFLKREGLDLQNLSIKILGAVKEIHGKGIIHCDIKPENFCVKQIAGMVNISLIDFNISQKYYLGEDRVTNGEHRPQRSGRGFIGNRRYASINAHRGLTLSRRDDIESLVYMLADIGGVNLP